ncbi:MULTISPECIES: nucleoside triphosphate pyrophosphohydrolase [unclassified Tatumella]|uniref:nucleoside triphosphate pyrophosphohydrolase n=1 Tax=unclassified Tatumella TaxID=2649542 RepID=UPI001BAFC0B8|nr:MULTISPECIES: nucleoside triphosphate pyrophosphohydrolase [unclassified Tatumella]MBS0855887.1 nucleoside triphosphate pyrophosphohydrolase [Tatumella sp. JGM16]MBS0912816.1 nucleoside triphosphate pyrophosphohydrolase [Tatumella sp. JGM91]
MNQSDTALQRLLDIMQQLRDPQQGCPWDKQQTFETIAPYTLEETYEVLDAIFRQDHHDLREELGDLLFQVVFYAQIAREQQLFDFSDICSAISEKLERRHPHIFAGNSVTGVGEINQRWEQLKQQEREQKSLTSALDDIPRAMPALMRAYKIQKRCSNVGFDWNETGPVLDKVHEEIAEVMEEATREEINPQRLEEELGDLLFATVNLSRHLGSKAETALQKANDKFEKRFRQVEQIIAGQGLSLPEATLSQMEAAWQQVKQQEKNGQGTNN